LIRVFEPRLSFADKYTVFKAISKNQISGTSTYVKEFEDKFANYSDRKFGIAVSNGSVALDVALHLLDLEEGDEVIVPSHTIISCLAAILRTKAKPVFCDVDPNSWNMTIENVKKEFTKKTKAVIVVHTFGLPSDVTSISDFCNENNIYLIEDAAEAHGQKENNKICGSFGNISTFSFYANKHLTTGEGGMILTNSDDLYKKALQIRNLDFTKERFKHENLYWNYRLSGIQAALGISQIDNIDKVIKDKREQGLRYLEILSNNDDLFQLPLNENNGSLNHFWVFGILLKKDNIRDKVIEELLKKGIETRPFFWPLHLQPLLQKFDITPKNSLPVSDKLGKNGLYIPLGRHISQKNQRYISKSLIDLVKNL